MTSAFAQSPFNDFWFPLLTPPTQPELPAHGYLCVGSRARSARVPNPTQQEWKPPSASARGG